MKLLRETIRRIMLQEGGLPLSRQRELSQKLQWEEVARIITRVLQGLERRPIVYSRKNRHSAELFNDGPNPPHMDKADIYGNPPVVWLRKGMGERGDMQIHRGGEGTTVLEIGSDLHGSSTQVHTKLEIKDIIADDGQSLYDILTQLTDELQ